MLAVKAGNLRELVEDAAPLHPIRRRIPVCYRRRQLVSRPMLIRLILDLADEPRSEQIRRGNGLASRSILGEAMRFAIVIGVMSAIGLLSARISAGCDARDRGRVVGGFQRA